MDKPPGLEIDVDYKFLKEHLHIDDATLTTALAIVAAAMKASPLASHVLNLLVTIRRLQTVGMGIIHQSLIANAEGSPTAVSLKLVAALVSQVRGDIPPVEQLLKDLEQQTAIVTVTLSTQA